MSRPLPRSRGTVSLVALCFVAVLGISLASYLTICTRSMQLSNRSYQSGLGQQLAELGLEEGLRAFNKGDWGGWSANPSGITGATTAWTLDTTNKRASRTLTFDSTRLGQNVTATVKIRVDNYDADTLGSAHNSTTSYRAGDLVGYNGIWYRCVRNNSNQTPNGMANMYYWVPAPIASFWNASNTYKNEDVVFYAPTNSWYRCILAPTTGQAPTNTTYWASITRLTVDNGYTATNGEVLNYFGTWYYYNFGWYAMPSSTPIVSWCWRSGYAYSFNDLVCYGYPAVWYRCIQPHTSSGSILPTNATYWENALSGSMSSWSSSGISYAQGDTVYYSTTSQWYRCILGHTSSATIAPTNTTYWATTPSYSQDWQPNRQYSQYDTVRYKGVWYLCLTSNNGQLPTDASSSYWAAAPQSLPNWSSASYYEVDDLVNNSGTWYRCIKPHKNQAPPNATYWTVLIGSGSSYVWNAATAYSAGSYRSYGGVWYKCTTATAANDGHNPNDSGYWTPTWTQPSNSSVTTGAPVVYAESTITIAGSPPIKTQIRAPIAPAPQFPNAVGSATTLTVGAGGTIDSYDGSVRSQTSGVTSTYAYNDQTNTPFSGTNANIGYTATLAAAGSTSPALTITSTTVKGFLAATPASTSPFAPLATFGTSASLLNSDGTATSADVTATNVDLSRISRSPYVPLPDTVPAGELSTAFTNATLPRGLALSLSANIYLGTPGATVPSRYYYNGDLTIGSGTVSTVTIVGPVILYINGDLQLTGSGANFITVTPTGSAEIHVADSLMVDAASNGIDNRTSQDPKKLIIICHTAAASTQYYQDVGNFFGTIYAPYTTNTTGLNMNNASSTPVYGAISAAKVNFANSGTVHYDTSLRYTTFGGVDQPYTVTQWRELPQTEQATMP
jgi:hypothetical protein